jgi:hypothetical protein
LLLLDFDFDFIVFFEITESMSPSFYDYALSESSIGTGDRLRLRQSLSSTILSFYYFKVA